VVTQYTIEWSRPSGSNYHRVVMHLNRGVTEEEAVALARGLASACKGVQLWKEEETTQVTRIELEEN
jgi:hypothetical protein